MKNEKLYTLTELVSFGNYLLSENRKQSIVHEYASDVVHEEDIANWADGCDVTAGLDVSAIFVRDEDGGFLYAIADNEEDKARLIAEAEQKIEDDDLDGMEVEVREVALNTPIERWLTGA